MGTDWDRVFLEYAVEYANITDRGEDPTRWYSDSDSRNSDAAEVCTPDGELCLISALYGGVYFDTVLTGSYDTLLNASGKTSDGEYYSVTTRAFDLLFGLGDVSFPAVIVSSSAVAEKIVGSQLWNLDTYSLEYSKWVTSDYNSLIVPVYTLLEPDYNPNTFRFGSPYFGPWYLCYSNILSSYGILVNPVGGIGSWTDGSAE
ncbi:MAG: hypothetical protein LUE31_06925, partial [Lachnospiraceae bacterium]|nr:hypothetical protein [Lachnospiraceae bacterium]